MGPVQGCESIELHTKRCLLCGTQSLDWETGTYTEFVVLKAKQRCGDCVGAREGSGILSMGESRALLRDGALNCLEGRERVARMRRTGARKAIQAGCEPPTWETAWVFMKRFASVLKADLNFSPQFSLLNCRILRFCGVERRGGGKGKEKLEFRGQASRIFFKY